MRIALVCNYAPDRQQSMLRFGEMLRSCWLERGADVTVLAPQASALARCRRWRGAAAKWIAYVDKYLLFPRALARRLREWERAGGRGVVHVVDHSNAVYVPQRRAAAPWIVTCHDLLAVRGALGEDVGHATSALGRRLQSAIVAGLGRADAIVCVSSNTLQDVRQLIVPDRAQIRRSVLLGLSHPYRPVAREEARARLGALGGYDWAKPFLLHVGSNLRRKNKAGVFRVFARLAERWPGNLVFCGAELPHEVSAAAAAAGLGGRVFAIPSLENSQLEAAYSLAHALVFPSLCEGFGWPVIEAQACGCPVICSDRTSLPEVGGAAALVHAFEDEAGMAESALRLAEPALRAGVIARGHANLRRFDTVGMIDAYAQVYTEALATCAPQ
ncbi:MAG TPA: glycosyltransferase family 1 protein [Opitutaceae bacterium]